jgi:hypothetical protein
MNYSENKNDSISMEKLLLYCEILKNFSNRFLYI